MLVSDILTEPSRSVHVTGSAAEIPASGAYLLEALRHIYHGRLTVATPEGKTLEFAGSMRGPIAQIRLQDWQVLNDLMIRGEVGFAQAYIDGRWESPDVAALLTFGVANTASLEHFFHGTKLRALWFWLKSALRINSLTGSRRNITAHYDLGNEFYALWLDRSMTYSCALFEGDETRTLEEAQQAKYRRILSKLAATPGDTVLEIGCGWGGFAEAAARSGLKVTSITISQKQADYAAARIARAGLSDRASIELRDYREMEGTFDHVVSIGMFEHVGERYWPVYFRTIRDRLKPGGTAMVQSITIDEKLFDTLRYASGFIEQYIFPGGMLPSKSRFRAALADAGLVCNEMYAFGQDYARTLKEWQTRFEAKKERVLALGYDEKFLRLWRFYYASCIAAFTSGRTDVMQVEIRRPA